MIKKILKLVVFVFLLTVVIVLLYQGYKLFNPSYVTERAVLYTIPDMVECYGIAIRDETVLEINTNGSLSFKVSDGQKVAANSVVASLYSSATIAEDVLIYELLLNERDILLKAKKSAENSVVNLDTTSKYIHQTIIELSRSIYEEDYGEFATVKLNLIEQLYTFSMNVYDNISPDVSIENINRELLEIEGRLSQSIEDITINEGGYFVSYIDYLEYLNYVNGEIAEVTSIDEEVSAKVLSVDDVCSLISSTAATRNYNAFKIIKNYTWYFAAVIDNSYLHRFYETQTLKLDLDRFYEKNLPVRIEKIFTNESSNRSIILFSCDYLNEELAGIRIAEGSISFRDYTGIRVPRSAIYIEDGIVGVYVKYDNKILFKKISYDFETPEYILVVPSENPNELRLYDEIIIEGKDLYNDKSI